MREIIFWGLIVISDRTANKSYGNVGEKKRSRREKTEWSHSSPEASRVF